MSDDDRSRPHTTAPKAHPVAVLLAGEAVGLAAVVAACLGTGAPVSAAVCLVLAAVAGGLAASIAEGFPRSGAAVIAFEGVTLAFAMAPRSQPAAVAVLAATATTWFCVHRRHGGVGQIRRPVSCQ